MIDPATSPSRRRLRRIVSLLLGGLVIEAALVGVVRLSPALRVIMRPVYLIVAVVFMLAIWHVSRRRENRRHGDRRHAASGK